MTLSPVAELVALAVDDELDARPSSTSAVSRLPGSCIGGSPGPPVAAPGASGGARRSARWPGSGGVSSSNAWPRARAAAAALAGADDDDRAALVEAQQLRERQVEAGGDPRGDRERRAGLAALDLREHRRADAAALGQVAQREVHRLAQRLDARADADRAVGCRCVASPSDERTLSRTRRRRIRRRAATTGALTA